MVKVVRKIGRRVDFNSETKEISFEKSEIKENFLEIKREINKIEKIRLKLKKPKIKPTERKKLTNEEKENRKKITDLWTDLSRINLKELKKEESLKLINSQKNFINDILRILREEWMFLFQKNLILI